MLLSLAACLVLAACGAGGTNTSASPDAPQPSATPSSSGAVSITNFAFTPATLTIIAGGAVTWTNNAPLVTHTVTNDDGSSISFDHMVAPNETFSVHFTQSGTYHYHCNIHPFMHGIIVVTATAATPTTTLGPTSTVATNPSPAPTYQPGA
jgi:plastocyanin